ncbi:MAG: Uma2 family endonuclease [Leptolyngbyaceae cyanobacterium CRU_2_3]|nr:Uma2 family endonuclease [Leptolyngbyaceae cyanobacterium CRU_2_3]
MIATVSTYEVAWEKLPDSFILDNEPVDNIIQPALAAALTESLELANRLPATALTTTNYGICATVNGKMIVKAPDWSYVPSIQVPRQEVIRSYTPVLEGDRPAIVMEFLSDTEGGEYSNKPTYPPGKWFFYEQVLQIPNYVIFEPATGLLEVYHLDDAKRYQIQSANASDRYWISEIDLFLGIWQGTRENLAGFWLRWWDAQGNLLLWAGELAQKTRQQAEEARQQAEAARQQAEEARQQAERLAAQLRAAGIEPEI